MKKIMFNDKYELTDAVLNERKTQTRRVIKIPDGCSIESVNINGREVYYYKNVYLYSHGDINGVTVYNFDGFVTDNAHYQVGEVVAIAQSYNNCLYDAHTEIEIDGKDYLMCETKGWNNKMFVRADLMLHHIKITNIRVERLQDISDADCIRESIEEFIIDRDDMHYYVTYDDVLLYSNPQAAFARLIDKVSGKGTWKNNPFVFVYEFELVD